MDVYDILVELIKRLFSANEREELLAEVERARKEAKKAGAHGTSK